jgi:bacillithiol system protein YtxJ
MLSLDDPAGLDRAVQSAVAVIYKHSPRCGSALFALEAVERFAARHPDVPVFQVDVVGHRALARAIAARLDVRHESPQVILLRQGRPVWVASHGQVDADALEAQLRAASPA